MQTLDQSRVGAFAGQVATEVGAALNAALVTVGDQLGLYRAMADAQPVRAGELAARTDTHERYVREWLYAQAAGGFVSYHAREDSYTLPAEHAFVLAGHIAAGRASHRVRGRPEPGGANAGDAEARVECWHRPDR